MNTHALRLPGLVFLLIAVAAVIAAISFGAIGAPRASAGTPPHFSCNGAEVDIKDTDDLVTHDTGSDKIVTGVCIKAGGTAEHEFFTADQADILGCYTITGIGTSSVTVERTGTPGPDCQAISHIDVIEGDAPTPTATPTATGTPPAEATPAATPTPTAAVLGETQEPAALPVSGGAPEEAIVSSLYLLLGLAGLALLIGGGTLVAVAVRRRR